MQALRSAAKYALRTYPVERQYRKKIAEILKGLPEARRTGCPWRSAYEAATGRSSDNYIREDDFYARIEPALNPPPRRGPYMDKNRFDALPIGPFPTTLFRLIRGRGRDASMVARDIPQFRGEVVVKPARETGGGAGVQLLSGEDAGRFLRGVIGRDSADFIVQAPLDQHPAIARLNPGSVNTLRVTTLRRDGGVEAISSVMRIGRAGARVDNQRAGGIVCGVTAGQIAGLAFDKAFNSYDRHPDSGEQFAGEVPFWAEAVALCERSHEAAAPDMDLISWDVAICDKPVLIELNVEGQELNFHQLCNGPLFGERGPPG